MKLSILANDKSKPGYLAEHGLSVYVNLPFAKILFDTGFTRVFLDNARKMGIDLNIIDYIVLSHGHYDHTGGLLYMPPVKNIDSIIVHKDALIPKYAMENPIRYNGIPFDFNEIGWIESKSIFVERLYEITSGVYVLGNIPHQNKQDKYYVDGKPDDFHDEMILIVESAKGLNILMGCSHYGVIEGINAVRSHFPGKKILNVLAGMHLGSKEVSEIKVIADYLETLELERLIPLHCTGEAAMQFFKQKFKEKCLLLEAGDEIEL